jgi:uncharacterized membrane protein
LPSRPPARAGENAPLELELGRVWLVRIGIVVLLTGLVFLGNLAYQHIVPRLTPAMKLALICLAGGTLAGTGAWLEGRRESLRNYARVLQAGGCAAIYYAAYAAHFVEVLRIIESPVLGGALLLTLAGGIGWVAHRRRSETLATLAVLLSYYTSCINPIGGFTLFSSLLLTATAVFFLVKNRWVRVTYLSVAATYASYAYWRFFAVQNADPGLGAWVQVGFLAGYWALFTSAAFLTDRSVMSAGARTPFLTLNNGAFFALASHALSAGLPGTFWLFAVGYGAVLLALGALAARRDPADRTLDGAYLAQGLALITTGLAARLAGYQLALVLAAQSTVLLTRGRSRQGLLFEIGGLLSAAGAFVLAGAGLAIGAPHCEFTAGVVALVLVFDAWWSKRRRNVDAMKLHPLAGLLTAAGLALGTAWLWKVGGVHFPAWAAIAALVLAFAPMAEVAVFSQALFPLAVFRWSVPTLDGGLVLSLDSSVMLASGIALAHWWPRQRRIALPLAIAIETAAAFSSAALALLWLRHEFAGPQVLGITALAGLLWICAALGTRSKMLMLAGLLFSAATVVDFVRQQADVHWALALLPVAHVAAVTQIARGAVARRFGSEFSAPASEAAKAGNLLAVAMLLWWSWVHIPDHWQPFFYAATSAVCAVTGALGRRTEMSAAALALGGLASVLFWSHFNLAPTWLDLLAVVVFPAGCRVARKLWPAGSLLEQEPMIAWCTVTNLTIWVTRCDSLPSLTAAWSLLALVCFAAGLLLRDRHYRAGGLALLGLAVGRVFFVDVWAFNPVYRIISFIVLGAVLLVVGYGYNRFEDKLRRWL